MEGQIDLVAKAYELAYSGFHKFMCEVADGAFDRDEVETIARSGMVVLAPMAAEIYRQMTRLVIVTVKEPKVTVGAVERLRDMMAEAGWQGMVSDGNVEFKFPEDDCPVEVTIDGKENASGNSCEEL